MMETIQRDEERRYLRAALWSAVAWNRFEMPRRGRGRVDRDEHLHEYGR